MQRLFVYADFDWLSTPRLVGELGYQSLRGTESYSFRFDEGWLRDFPNLSLSADLQPFSGYQYTSQANPIFGCFSDTLPDRWGRTLLERREQIEARDEGRAVRRLSSLDYLLGIDDRARMGGFRFCLEGSEEFINTDSPLSIPPITELRTLEELSRAIEQSEQLQILPEREWITRLIQPASSLGGARPKASVTDTDGSLYIAKFPSRQDSYNVGLWEHLCHRLATRSGIRVAETRVIKSGGDYHSFLSRRFDRREDGKRIHFASAMTLLGLQDGDNASSGKGYLDIVDFILQHCTQVEENLQELYRRVAFNICIGNSDDHFRNHGFLLSSKGWILSPAFDLNPTLHRHQSLLISRDTSEARLSILLDASGDYMLSRAKATELIEQVLRGLEGWQDEAVRLGLPRRDIELFGGRWAEVIQEDWQ